MGNDETSVSTKTEINTGSGDDNVVNVCKIFCFHEQTIMNVLEKDDKIDI